MNKVLNMSRTRMSILGAGIIIQIASALIYVYYFDELKTRITMVVC